MKPYPSTLAPAIASALFLPALAHAEAYASADPDSNLRIGSTIAAPAMASNAVIGRVRESSRGVQLQGASISIDGRRAHSDQNGQFRIIGLEPGRHVLRVEYMGYEAYEGEIVVDANDPVEADIVLERQSEVSGQLEQMVVYGQRDANALALNQQRASGNLVNVVSADLLGQFPDNNIAESTQRIPGISIERDQGEGRYVSVRGAPKEFTTVTIDGAQLANPDSASRGVELDTLPSDVISELEVTKALTPDMDGDAIGGNINIRTQSALDRDGLTLRASLGLGRFQLGDGDNQRATATVGQRFGADRHIGVLLSASHSKQGRFTDNVETLYARQGANGPILPEEVQIKDYEGTRRRNGLSARFDLNLSSDHHLHLIATHASFKDREFRDNLIIGMDRHSDDADPVTGTVRATFDKELRERSYDKSIRTLNLGGEHWLGDWRAQWQLTHSHAEKTANPRMQYIFRSRVRPQMHYDYSNPDFPIWAILDRDDAPPVGVDLPESWFDFRRLNDRQEYGEENETGLRIDFSRDTEMMGGHGELRFGLRSRLRDKSFDDERRRNGERDDFQALGLGMSDLLCSDLGRSSNFGYFHAGRRFCRNIFTQHAGELIASPSHQRLLEASVTGDYSAEEDIHAAYLRLDQTWGALSLITGARIEHTRISGDAAHFNTDTQAITPSHARNSYTHILPSVHLRHELGQDSILRASYSTGLNRPDFRHVAPYRTQGELETSPIAEGNPGIKAAYAHNFDLSFEHYLEPLGLISAALFHKQIKNPLFVANSTHTLPSGESVRLTRPENGRSGHVHGLELAWQQTFESLPSPFNGLGIYANYTLAKSRAELPFGLGKTELPGTSRHNYNLALSYEKYGLSTRLAWNRRSDYIQEFDISDPELNIHWGARSSLDFSASYAFYPNWRLFAEANNLADTRQVRFQGQRNRVLELEGFGRSYLLGLRYEY